MSYDYTVLAGTQGAAEPPQEGPAVRAGRALAAAGRVLHRGRRRPARRHRRHRRRRPRLHGVRLVRRSSAASCRSSASPPGRCFAGNAALLGCCDVVIATADSNIGMGGPAMIEGGGLGVFRPDEVGPMSVQVPNGVVDIAVADEAEAVAVAKQYLSYFQGPVDRLGVRRPAPAAPRRSPRTGCASTTSATVIDDAGRHRLGARAAPRVRRRAWSPRSSASRAGRSGVIANNPTHLGGAIDSRRRRQGGALHAAVRRVRPPDPVPVRHARDHGRARGREDRARAPLQPHVRHRRQPHRAVLHDRAAQGLRPRRAGDGRAAASRRRSSRSPGRPASSAAWASRARCSSATARSSRRSRTRPSATALFEEMVGADVRARARRSTPRPTSRSTT